MPLPPTRPTLVRYTILGLLCLLAMITYLDRAVIGSAKGDVMAAVGHPAEDFFWMLVAFQLAYALFEVPTGWMGDTFGPRATILRIVLWWSTFIALTGLAGYSVAVGGSAFVPIGFATLVGVQFLFGIGEAGAFPNITRALYNWFPATSRGFAQGTVWMSARFMGGLTPLVWLALSEFAGLSWRQVFFLFAAVAALWCLVFFGWFRNRPAEHPFTNEAEQALVSVGKAADEGGGHAGVPWGRLVRSPNLWAICGMYFCTNYGWYFLMYFLPGFMKQFARPEDDAARKVWLALLTGGPLLVGMAGCYLGGLLTDFCVRKFGRRWGRRVMGMVGFGLSSLCYAAGILAAEDMTAFLVCIISMGFVNDLTMGACWATCQDVGRRYAAIVAGCMNMIGNLGGTLTNFVTGQVIKRYTTDGVTSVAGYQICFAMYAVAFVLGALFWLRIDASKPVVPVEEGD